MLSNPRLTLLQCTMLPVVFVRMHILIENPVSSFERHIRVLCLLSSYQYAFHCPKVTCFVPCRKEGKANLFYVEALLYVELKYFYLFLFLLVLNVNPLVFSGDCFIVFVYGAFCAADLKLSTVGLLWLWYIHVVAVDVAVSMYGLHLRTEITYDSDHCSTL